MKVKIAKLTNDHVHHHHVKITEHVTMMEIHSFAIVFLVLPVRCAMRMFDHVLMITLVRTVVTVYTKKQVMSASANPVIKVITVPSTSVHAKLGHHVRTKGNVSTMGRVLLAIVVLDLKAKLARQMNDHVLSQIHVKMERNANIVESITNASAYQDLKARIVAKM